MHITRDISNWNIKSILSVLTSNSSKGQVIQNYNLLQSELLGQFRLISDRASDVSGGRICLTQNAYAEL